MRVYLASRFSRIDELREYRTDLLEDGIEVTSRWLNGGHEWSGVEDDAIPVTEAARFAREDLEDIEAADTVVAFTEPPRSSASRGGRHVEFGYALHAGKPLIAVGYRENVFMCLEHVAFVEDWPQAHRLLLIRRTERVIAVRVANLTLRGDPAWPVESPYPRRRTRWTGVSGPNAPG